MPGPIDFLASYFDLIVETIISGIISYVVFYYYFIDLDRKTESFDKDLREDIQKEPSLRGIRDSSNFEIIATSDSSVSTATVPIRKLRGSWSDVPQIIVPVDGRSPEKRHEEVIRIHAREIPGKNIIQSDLVASIRNYYAYKMALGKLGPESEVTRHFQSLFEAYDYSGRVRKLAEPDHYNIISILDEPEGEIRPLDDIFLQFLKGAERHLITPIDDVDERDKEIQRCREFMMEFFWGLYAEVMKGVLLNEHHDADYCISRYRVDIRDEDNIGYWILPEEGFNEQEFERFLHIGWNIEEILDDYWDMDNFSTLHTPGSSIPDMEKVDTPFVLFRKSLEEFAGGPRWMRIKEDPRYRRKEEYS